MASHFNTRTGGSNTGLAFVVGALVVLVVVLGYFAYTGWDLGNDDVIIRIDGGGSVLDGAADAIDNAADAVGDAVQGN